MACEDAYTTAIDELYRMQVGNPGLLQDHNEAIADCLRRTGQVEPSYDGEPARVVAGPVRLAPIASLVSGGVGD